MEKTLKERRETDRERQRRWRARRQSEGKKPVSVMLSKEVKNLIDRERRRTGETIAQLVERAIHLLSDSGPAMPEEPARGAPTANMTWKSERADSMLKRIIEGKEK